MSLAIPPSSWSSAAPTYSSRIGLMDLPASHRLIDLATTLSPLTPSSRAMDLGSGTGTLTHALASLAPTLPIAAVDVSPGMLAELAHATTAKPWITVHEMDAKDIEQRRDEFDAGNAEAGFSHILSTFMLQYTPSPLAVLRAAHALLRPGGVLGIGLWGDGNGPVQLWTEACAAADPAYCVPHAHEAGAWTTPEQLRRGLQEAGFRDVRTERMLVPFGTRSTEEVARFWFEGGNPVPGRLVADWVRRKGGVGGVRGWFERICREGRDDGRGVRVEVVLGVGVK